MVFPSISTSGKPCRSLAKAAAASRPWEKAILRLAQPTSGELRFDGKSYVDAPAGEMKAVRRRLQAVFQDPYSSMNPRMRVRETIAEPLYNFGLAKSRAEATEKVRDLLAQVGLPSDAWSRFPHEFSGRSATAPLHRPRPCARRRSHHLRRSGFGARCFRQGANRQPPVRPSAEHRRRFSVHQP